MERISKIIGYFIILLFLWNGNATSYIYGKLKSIPFQATIDTPNTLIESIESFPQRKEQEDNTKFLPTPKTVVRTVEYDIKTNLYLITEKVNGKNIKPPMYLTFEEYVALTEKEDFNKIVEEKNKTIEKPKPQKDKDGNIIKDAAIDLLKEQAKGIKTPLDGFKIPTQGMLFGDGGIEIKPQGNLDVQMGYNHNTIRNPALSPNQQSQGLIDFDMGMNISVMGKIGDKFQNTIRYNNQANFGFEGQQIKLAYNGKEDEIIRNLEAGDVSFTIPTQLIKSAQSLWGLKTELQFGKLNIKAALSQQRSSQQCKTIENGTVTETFDLNGDQYDQNRHFFLSHYFRDLYEKSLANFPMVNSPIQINNVEVWVSNRNITTTGIRDVIGFQDLGECSKIHTPFIHCNGSNIPSNESNDLYSRIKLDNDIRNGNTAMGKLIGPTYNLKAYQDFEKGFLRKLSPSEYTLQPQLGYISLNSTLQPNDILAVSYQYLLNGQLYQVGDLSRDITLPDTSSNEPSRILYLKTLKGTNFNPSLPTWDLMMKNVYSLPAYQISKDNFRLDIFYNDPGGGLKRYLPRGTLQNEPLIRTLSLDRLNVNNEPYPDGVFDFVPNMTINPNNGKIYFPVLEPFGEHIKNKLEKSGNSPDIVKQFNYSYLYDSTLFIAQQYPELNRYTIKGSYQSSTNKRISLGFNTPAGSVYVTMNGQRLIEGQDYIVETGGGSMIELMDHVMTGGGKIQICYENNIAFGLQTKNFMGLRAEYRFNDKFKIGSTYEKLSERPFNNKINFGEDPISNQILGGDISYSGKMPWLTKILDALPFYKTSEMSTINAYAEYARLIPGHYASIGGPGTVYLDDFEGASINYNFGNIANLWRLASTPLGAKNGQGRTLFSEASLIEDIKYGYNRAKLSWYNIAPLWVKGFTPPIGPDFPPNIKDDIYQRLYRQQDVYVNKQNTNINNILQTFDLAYHPKERGPYNYEISPTPTAISQGVNSDGSLKAPTTRWSGIQRSIENSNFENYNIEYVQFWMLNPFTKNKTNKGDLYFNLGYISEDVLKDSRMAYEHGLVDKKGPQANLLAQTVWSWVPKIPSTIPAFDNNPDLRPLQDVGLDGVSDIEERIKFKDFLTAAQINLNPAAYSKLQNDPSSDNFKHYLDESLPKQTIVGLYKEFGGVENNSPISSGSQVAQSNYISPDNEDINRDNTLNENEAYFQYRVPLFESMDVSNHPYIVSRQVSPTIKDADNDSAEWFQFRIPIKEYQHRVGNIGDFRNIQFVRMFLTNFEDSAYLRMVDLNFVRNQWRKYTGSIQSPIDFIPKDNGEASFFDVGSVSLEENSNKTPVNYVVPSGIVREVGLNANSNPIQLNEQSLRLRFCGIKDGEAKAAFKPFDFDFRQYQTLKLFVHAENNPDAHSEMQDKDMSAFIRIGSDFKENYYEYEIPLKVTPKGNYSNLTESDKKAVWPDSNQMIINIQDLVAAKYNRNKTGFPQTTPYVLKQGNHNITVVGNPDLGLVKNAMLGFRNRSANDLYNFKSGDDGESKCGEIWFNEMRLEGLNEQGGQAAVGNVEIKLADLGTANFSSSLHTAGYGQIYEKVNERKRDNLIQYSFNTTLQLHRLLPKWVGIQLPFYLQTGQTVSTPQFDPYSNDIIADQQIDAIRAVHGSDSSQRYKESMQTIDKRYGFNFTNVRYMPEKPSNSIFPLSPRFFTLNYSHNSIRKSNPFIQDDWMRTYSGALNYSYAAQPIYIEPFKKLIKSKSKAWDWIKSTHLNLIPNSISFTNQLDRMYGVFQQRTLSGEQFVMPSQFVKSFTWNRNYTFDYNPIRSLNIAFNASNQARIDETQGAIDSKAEDSIISSLKKFGRTTAYNHNIDMKYSLPISKVIPMLNWVTSSMTYKTGYNWTTGPQIINSAGKLIQSPQGNIISNTQSIGTQANFKMGKLYAQIPFLKNADIDNSRNNIGLTSEQKESRDEATRRDRQSKQSQLEQFKSDLSKLKDKRKIIKDNDSLTKPDRKKLLKDIRKQIKEQRFRIRDMRKNVSNTMVVPTIIKILVQPLMAVRDIDASYNIENTTSISGYTQKTKYFGIDVDETNQLDPSFVLGSQPGIGLFSPPDKYARYRWLDDFANKGFLTKDSTFNLPFTQSSSKTFRAKIVIEPFKNLRVNLNWESDYTQKYTEYFIYNQTTGQYEHRNPMESGSYTYSDINLFTAFKKINNSGVSEVVTSMDKNRELYAQILQSTNPNSINQVYIDPLTQKVTNGFYNGYGPLQQDVLLNSFLTSYRGGQATGGEKNLSPFSRIPLPNWSFNYNGLTQYPMFKKIFENFNIKHGYSSKTTIANFTSELRYFGGGSVTNPIKVDSLNNNFIPFYFVPNVSMTESFTPLIGIDFTLKNKMNFKFEYKSSRQVAMSLIDYQLTENVSSGFTAGFGYQTKKIVLPWADDKGKNIVIEKGARISCDVTYSNNIIVNHKLGQTINTVTGGGIRLMISPKLDCQVTDKFNLSLFYNYVYNEPKIQNAFLTINGSAGVKMSFSIAQ